MLSGVVNVSSKLHSVIKNECGYNHHHYGSTTTAFLSYTVGVHIMNGMHTTRFSLKVWLTASKKLSSKVSSPHPPVRGSGDTNQNSAEAV